MIIALHGRAGAGKDTFAEYLSAERHFSRIAFADPLREFLMSQNPWVRNEKTDEFRRLNYVINAYGWQGYKKSPYGADLRVLIQRTGTEAGREIINNDVWVNITTERVLSEKDVIVTDCRFPNELEAMKNLGAQTVKIVRPGERINDHSSEQDLPDMAFDWLIYNSGTFKDLEHKAKSLLGNLKLI